MAKRVLSLLLALVMALSLCVPAFAAEGTDAAAEGEADEPATIALEKPDDREVQEKVATLKTSVAELEALKADIESGAKTYDWGEGDTVDYYSGNGLYAVIDEVNALIGKIEGKEGTVTSAEIDAAQAKMAKFLEGGSAYDKFITGPSAKDKKDLADALAACYVTSSAGFKSENGQKNLNKTYQPDFVAELGAALEAAEALQAEKHPTHLAYAQMIEKITALAKTGEKAKKAALPVQSDADALIAKIEELKAIAENKASYTNASYTTAQIDSLISECADFVVPTNPLGIKTMSLWDLKTFIEKVDAAVKQLETNEALLYISGVTMAENYQSINVKLATNDKADDGKGDENKYVVTATLTGGNEMCGSSKFDATAPGAGQLASALVGATPNITLANLLTGATALADHGNKFLDGDVVTLQVYKISGGKAIAVGDPYVYTVNGDYNGPMIEKAEFQLDGSITVTLTKALNTTYPNGELVVKDASGAVVVDKTAITSGNGTSVTLNFKTGVTAAVGSYTVELSVKAASAESEAGTTMALRDTKTFAIANITNYKADPAIKDADIAKADTLAKKVALANGKTGYDILTYLTDLLSDYEDYVGNGATTTADAYKVAARILNMANEIITDAATTVDNTANRGDVDEVIGYLTTALGKLVEPTATSPLEDAIKAAQALVEKDYTAESWTDADLKTKIKAGQDYLDSLKGQNADAAKIKQLAEAITDAIDELVINPTDKTELKKAIAAVPSDLETGNYSPDAVAAVKLALAEAQDLNADLDAPQSKIDAAASALLAAIGALKTVNGWVMAANGDFYYYQNGQMVKNQWVMSTRGLWYHMSASGVMDTGLTYITDSEWGSGWYYLQESNRSNNCIGMMLKGWQQIIDDNGYGAGNIGWFETRTNGHGGKCTYTNEWGDFKNYVKQ